jgi:protein ImuB
VVKKPAEPTVIVETTGSRCQILVADPSAEALGVVPGLKLNAGYALAPNLHVHARDIRRETRLLEFLAGWARRFTSMVSLERPDTLLLEVGGSLRLFGSLQALQGRLQQSLRRWYLDNRYAVAPFPRAALWLARSGCSNASSAENLVGNLSSLPLSVTGWPVKAIRTLKEMGVTTVGDCLRLPRDGLARRLGPDCLLDLDRALGKQSDPRSYFLPPQRLTATLQLSGEVEHAAELQEAGEQMLKELGLALRRRQAAVQAISFSLHHLSHAETLVQVAALEPSNSTERFSRLLKDRLENTALPAPVIAVSLRSGRLQSLKSSTGSLFARPGGSGTGSDFAELFECLRNRFGPEAVYGLCLVPEHRPESAWIKLDKDLGQTKNGPRSNVNRPLWMLCEPAPLVVTPSGPCYEGVLSLEQGPERIETGWWDGRDVARDYFYARNPSGMGLWIYRQRRGRRGWYLHGIFG